METMTEIFFELYTGLPQEGPGDQASTMRALSMISPPPHRPRILDVGCGSGRHTIFLAEITGGEIIGVDTHQPFLDEVLRKAAEENTSENVSVINCSMTEMDFEENSFDIIWSEGAIYIMGFREGLENWKRFLKPGGYLVVTEASWLIDNPPEEILKFWEVEYPGMKRIDQNLEIVRNLNYKMIDYFNLPVSSWWDDYYTPLENRIVQFREMYAGDKAILEVLEASQREIDLYRRYSDTYGYVFYIMQKSL